MKISTDKPNPFISIGHRSQQYRKKSVGGTCEQVARAEALSSKATTVRQCNCLTAALEECNWNLSEVASWHGVTSVGSLAHMRIFHSKWIYRLIRFLIRFEYP